MKKKKFITSAEKGWDCDMSVCKLIKWTKAPY